MHVAFHLGAPFTDEERLIQTLANDPAALDTVSGHTPYPRAYRTTMHEALIALNGAPADAEWSGRLRQAWSRRARKPVERLIFSFDGFLAPRHGVIGAAGLFPDAAERMCALANLFPDAQIEFLLGLLNPAVLIAELVAAQPDRSLDDILAGQPPQALRWWPALDRMAAAARHLDASFVVWCNEDLPLIAPRVMRRMGALAENTTLLDEDKFLAPIMTPEGLEQLRNHFTQNPRLDRRQRQRVVVEFLERHARPEALEVELAVPGWTEALVTEISEAYDADVARIAALEGVQFITP